MKNTVLFIDDLAPNPKYGAGFGRAKNIVDAVLKSGLNVIIYVRARRPLDRDCASFWPKERLRGFYEEDMALPLLLEKYGSILCAVWVSRAANITRYADCLISWAEKAQDIILIADTEAITSTRKLSRRMDIYDEKNMGEVEPLIRQELFAMQAFDYVVCVSDLEITMVCRIYPEQRYIKLGHCFQPLKVMAGFEDRQHFLFLGAFHAADSPNMDSVIWFMDYVWPHIQERLPNAEFHIAGYLGSRIRFPMRMKGRCRVLGREDDLAACFSKYRVFVAPTRYAVGVPHKVHQAMALGLPSAVTDILAKQLAPAEGSRPFLHAPIDPERFADICVRLYSDQNLWQQVQNDAWQYIESYCAPDKFEQTVKQLVVRGD